MAHNVEIKARARDFVRQFRLAAQLADGPGTILHQEDVFFRVETGRLKLRFFTPERGELIAYHRPDRIGPKTSHYEIYPTREPKTLQRVLAETLPLLGKVIKKRTLFLRDQTRIHCDEVEHLGCFFELEVVLAPGQDPAEGRAIAATLMKELAIRHEDLIDQAYIDLLLSPGKAP